MDRVGDEGPLDLATAAAAAVDRGDLDGGDIKVEAGVVVEHLVAEAVVDGVDGEKLLLHPSDGGLIRVVWRRSCGGTVASEAGLALDALHLSARIDVGHPFMEAAKVLKERPDLVRSGGFEHRSGFSFPFGLRCFCHPKGSRERGREAVGLVWKC